MGTKFDLKPAKNAFKTMIKLLFSFAIVFSSTFIYSQEEDAACLPPDKKTEKILIKAVNAQDAKTAVDNFKLAMDALPDNAMITFEYAKFAFDMGSEYYKTYPSPDMGNKSMTKAAEMFQTTLDVCKEYHADCYYYLGVIYYGKQDNEKAIENFKKFVSFKSTEATKYSEDHSKKMADVKEVLKSLEAKQEVVTQTVPFDPSMVKNVSSKEHEYFPMISPDNELMFYTRKVDRRNFGDNISKIVEEFTFSTRPNVSDFFSSGNPLGLPFNNGTFESYGAATVAVDNKEMILCACKSEDIYGQKYLNCDLYSTTYERTGSGGNDFIWTPLVNMGQGINTKDGWEGQPTLAADGNLMYFTTTRKGSRDNDIYVVERQKDGKWGNARPFDEINTAGKDKSPFLHQDSETLYFVSSVSDQRKGVGGLDIFYTRKENGKWSEPKNIGYPINTAEDELGIFVSTDGKLAYYSSRQGGDWNIYSFELYPEARPQAVAILKGELKDENGQPSKDATIEISYEGSDEVSEIKVNGNDGKYAAVVKINTNSDVMVTVKKEGAAFDSKVIAKEVIANTKDVSIRNNDLQVKELKVGEAYTINDILYATNSSDLNSKSKFILRGFARFLKENPSISVAIQGHTDDVGDDSQNMKLSEDRAQGVKSYLTSLGISAKQLSAKGYGETKPKVENTSAENRAQNRRTDFVIVGM